jgi:hypothetical protein
VWGETGHGFGGVPRGVVGFAVMRLIDRRLFITIVASILTSVVILWLLIFLLLLVAGPF